MPDPRIIEYRLAASENVTGVAQKVAADLKRIARTTETIDFTPMRKITRTREDQDVRNELAQRAKDEREQVRRERVQFLADERQFGTKLAQERRRTRQRVDAESRV